MIRVYLYKLLEVFAQLVDRVDRIGATGRNTSAAVDASCRIDIQLGGGIHSGFIFLGVNAVGRTYIYTKEVFDAGIGNYIGHGSQLRTRIQYQFQNILEVTAGA